MDRRRKTSAIVAGWLTLTSAAWAQTNQASGPPTNQVRTVSPYHVTASTLDWVGEASEVPPEMPTLAVPRIPIGRLTSTQPPTAQPPVPSGASPTAPSAPMGIAPATPIVGGAFGQPTFNEPFNSCCDSFDVNCPCGPQGRMWGSVEYLLWTTRGMNVPALVTASPLGTPRDAAGVLGDPRTSIVFGGRNINGDFRSGFRIYSGMWLDECQSCGIDTSTFYLEPGNDSGASTCFTNAMIFARPFIDVNPASTRFASELVCFPKVMSGGVFVNTTTHLWGTDINARKNLCCGCDFRLDLLGGYRYMQLEDRVNISEQVAVLDPAGAAPFGTGFNVFDGFYSKNTFNGGQIGFAGEVRRGRFFATTRGLVALGSVHKEIEIAGLTTIAIPGQVPQSFTGGLLTQPTNVGKYTLNEFAVLPEATVSLGYQLTDGIRASVGYTFLYLSNVSRAGNQIDPVVNSAQLPPPRFTGPARPAFNRSDTDFWTQGVNFGLEIRF